MTHFTLARLSSFGSLSKTRLADIALALTYAAVISLFVKSATLLERLGYHYMTPGGFPWEKFHPGTIVAVCALVARIFASSDPRREATRLVATDRALTLYFLALIVAAAQGALVTGYPVSGLVDTFTLPALLLILTRDLDPRIRRSLAVIAFGVMTANALVGLAEYLTGWRLVPLVPAGFVMPDPNRPDPTIDTSILAALSDWRATALLGHPLENAFLTGTLVLCLACPGARWVWPWLRYPLMALSIIAMVAFGGRSSFVLSLVGVALYGLAASARMLASGASLPKRAVAIACLIVPVLVTAAYGASEAGFFDRFIDRFVNDAGSAEARVRMWDMFDVLTTSDILLGPNQDVVAVQQHLIGLELGIESFWVALTLNYGLIVAGLLFIGLGLLAWRVVATGGPGSAAIMLYYFVNASTSTSLSSKTTTFGLVILMVVLILQADRRSDILIPGVYASKPRATA